MSKSTTKRREDILARVAVAAQFDAEAEARYAEILRTGKTIPAQEVHDYLQRFVQEALASSGRG